MSTFLVAGGKEKAVLGMVHLGPLPGTPFHGDTRFSELLERAVADAKALDEGGATGCLVQSVDRVYTTRDESDPARVAAMSLAVGAIRRETREDFQVGVQLMWNAVKASIAVAKVTGGSFVRANAIIGASVTAHGIVSAEPLDVMQYRRALDARDVQIVADVHTMHFRWCGDDRPVVAVAGAAARVGADAVCVCDPDEAKTLAILDELRDKTPDLPVVIGGHTSHANAARLLERADGVFVGSCVQRGGWSGAIDRDRVRAYVDIVQSIDA